MTNVKNIVAQTAIAALLGVGAMAATIGIASARVICNAEGDCWHTDQKVKYLRELKVQIHPDSWYFQQRWDADHRYHEHHDDRGYYKGGLWITL